MLRLVVSDVHFTMHFVFACNTCTTCTVVSQGDSSSTHVCRHACAQAFKDASDLVDLKLVSLDAPCIRREGKRPGGGLRWQHLEGSIVDLDLKGLLKLKKVVARLSSLIVRVHLHGNPAGRLPVVHVALLWHSCGTADQSCWPCLSGMHPSCTHMFTAAIWMHAWPPALHGSGLIIT